MGIGITTKMFKLLIFMILLKLSKSSYETQNSEIAKTLHRSIRSLSFPDASTMGIFFALAVPLPDPEKSVSLSYFFEATYSLPSNSTIFEPWNEKKRKKRGIDRIRIYRTLENKFESFGYSGRGCLLRSICEHSSLDLEDNGVLGDIVKVIFSPSTSQPEDLPQDIVEAEIIGHTGTCTIYNTTCPMGLFDLIGILL